MTTDVLDGVTARLRTLGLPIEFENVGQGFEQPSFYVRILSTSVVPGFGHRKLRECNVLVRYFPEDPYEPRAEILEMEELLYDLLETIELKTIIIRGHDMHTREVDKTLQMEVTYRYAITELEEKEEMQDWQIEQNPKMQAPEMMKSWVPKPRRRKRW